MGICIALFEDSAAADFNPLAATRPVFDLVLGAFTARQRFERLAGQAAEFAAVRPHLRPLLAERGLQDLHAAGDGPQMLRVNGAWIATADAWQRAAALAAGQALVSPSGRILAVRGQPDSGQAARTVLDNARLLAGPWDLVGRHVETLREDLAQAAPGAPPQLAAEVTVRGRDLTVAGDAILEGPLVLDARGGPIQIARAARLAPFSVVEGPAFIGEGARILGGRIAGSFIGPACRVRGEVEASVILGWTNKSHAGFLGHAYVGEWVNLGALTTNSDLKNNYGQVRGTGLLKAGCLLGDHVKTAIGTLLTSGTVVGVGCNLFGTAGAAPRRLPDFLWGAGDAAAEYRLERFMQTAETVCGRRGRALSAAERGVLSEVHLATRADRAACVHMERKDNA